MSVNSQNIAPPVLLAILLEISELIIKFSTDVELYKYKNPPFPPVLKLALIFYNKNFKIFIIFKPVPSQNSQIFYEKSISEILISP